MSLQRNCYLCGRPVSIRRRMSLFCSERCELRHRFLAGPAAAPPAPPRRPEGPLGPSGPRPERPPIRP